MITHSVVWRIPVALIDVRREMCGHRQFCGHRSQYQLVSNKIPTSLREETEGNVRVGYVTIFDAPYVEPTTKKMILVCEDATVERIPGKQRTMRVLSYLAPCNVDAHPAQWRFNS